MKIRFQADNDLRFPIAKGVKRREPAIDICSAQEAALDGLPDSEVLALAAAEGRVLVTQDLGTMPKHFREFVAEKFSPGVFLISQELPIGVAVEELVMGWAVTEAEDWENRLVILPRWNTMHLGSIAKLDQW